MKDSRNKEILVDMDQDYKYLEERNFKLYIENLNRVPKFLDDIKSIIGSGK